MLRADTPLLSAYSMRLFVANTQVFPRRDGITASFNLKEEDFLVRRKNGPSTAVPTSTCRLSEVIRAWMNDFVANCTIVICSLIGSGDNEDGVGYILKNGTGTLSCFGHFPPPTTSVVLTASLPSCPHHYPLSGKISPLQERPGLIEKSHEKTCSHPLIVASRSLIRK